MKFKYSPSDNSSSSSASLARTSAGSDTGSRSAIPPLQKHLNLCFPTVSPAFFLVQSAPKNPQNSNSPCVSHRVRQRRCETAAKQPPSQRLHGGCTSGGLCSENKTSYFFFVTILLLCYFIWGFCLLQNSPLQDFN